MATRMQQRRGTAATWTTANPILGVGEIGYETDTNKFKIGDGTNRWANLNYFVDANSILDGAPELLNNLNELAAALGDDPAFFTTVATNLANHEADTTNVHGIANTQNLVTLAGSQTLTNKTLTSPVINTPTGIVKADVGLGNVDNTSDANKPVSTAQAAADTAVANAAASDATTKANAALASANAYTDDAVADLINSAPGALNTLNELAQAIGDDANYASTITNALALKAPLANPNFTGTVSGITKDMVGLSNVDNTSDANKPVSTAQAAANSVVANNAATDATSKANAAEAAAIAAAAADATTKANTAEANAKAYTDTEISDLDSSVTSALNLKAPLASPTFTGTVSGITKAMVGLGNVDNTSDINKPVSTATQTELDLKAPLASPALTGTPTAPTAALGTKTTQVATTAFVDAAIEALAGRNLVLDGGGV